MGGGYRVSASPTTATAQPPLVTQPMESRPTFVGQLDTLRLAIYGAFGIVIGLLYYYVGAQPAREAILVGAGATLAFIAIDLLFSTGFLHKLVEQETERKRIEAAYPAEAHDVVHDEQIGALWEYLYSLEARLDALNTLKIGGIGGEREIPKADTVDLRIRQWLTTEIFPNGQLAGVYANGQIKRSFPFKGTSDDPEDRAGWSRLTAAGLVGLVGNNYIWTGPTTLGLTMQKLQMVAKA